MSVAIEKKIWQDFTVGGLVVMMQHLYVPTMLEKPLMQEDFALAVASLMILGLYLVVASF